MVTSKIAVVISVTLLALRVSSGSSAIIEDPAVSVTIDADGPTPVGSALKFFLRLYDDCGRKDGLVSCAKLKVAALLERVARAGDIPLTDSVTLVRSSREGPSGRAMTESELEEELPAVEGGRDAQITELLLDRLAKSLTTHSLQLNFPKVTSGDLRAIGGSSGRGKMKGMMKMMMMGAAMGVMGMLPIMMGGVSMLALKALVVSKLALILAIIMILKKLLAGGGGGGGGHSSGGSGWSSGSGGGSSGGYGRDSGGGGWDKRSADLNAAEAQMLAYSAHVQPGFS